MLRGRRKKRASGEPSYEAGSAGHFPVYATAVRHSRKVEGTATDIRIRRDADGTDTVYQESGQPTAKPEVGASMIEGLEKSRREVSSDVIFGKAELPQSNPVQEKTAQSALYRADMSELQSDAFADDLSTDQEDAWRNEETAAASEANLFQKVKEEPETEYLGPEEEPAVDSGRSVESRRILVLFCRRGKAG